MRYMPTLRKILIDYFLIILFYFSVLLLATITEIELQQEQRDYNGSISKSQRGKKQKA